MKSKEFGVCTFFYKAIIPVLLIGLFSACGHKNEKEIEEQQSSGIVLVQNQSF